MEGIFKNILQDQINGKVRQRSRNIITVGENSFDLVPHTIKNCAASEGELRRAWEHDP